MNQDVFSLSAQFADKRHQAQLVYPPDSPQRCRYCTNTEIAVDVFYTFPPKLPENVFGLKTDCYGSTDGFLDWFPDLRFVRKKNK